MAIQNLRSSDAHKRPIPTVLSAGQIAINTNQASPGLFFKDSNGDLVKVGPIHIGTSAPNSSPATTAADALVSGTVYQILTVGNTDFTAVGASANTVGVVFTATGAGTGTGTVSGQQGNEKGEQWLDTTGGTYVLKIYDGTAWRSESGTFVDVSGDNMTGNLTLGTDKVILNATSGAATFAGIINCSNRINVNNTTTTASDIVHSINTGSSLSTTQRTKADGTIQLGSVNGGADTANIVLNADGSAKFNSSIQSGEYAAGAAGSIQIFNNTASAQAFKVGNTTNGSNIAMKSDGSATFAGAVTVTDGTSNVYSYLSPGGNVQAARAAQSATASVWEGYGAGSLTSKINSDGSASLAAANTEIAATGQLTIKKTAPFTDPSFRILDRNNSNANGVLMYGDGSATFAGQLRVNNQAQIYRPAAVGGSTSGNTLLIFKSDVGGTAVTKASITTDGAAEFAGNTIVGSDPDVTSNSGCKLFATGTIRARSTSSTSSGILFEGFGAGQSSSQFKVNADGSAIFAGPQTLATPSSPASNGYTAHINNTEASTAACYSANNHNAHGINFLGVDGANSNAITCKIMNDGSATFGVFPNRLDINAGYLLQYSNQAQANLVLRKTDSLRNSDPVLEVQNNTAAVKAKLYANGSAEFAGGAALFKNTGELQIDRTNASNTLLGFYLNGSNTGFIRADGSATFKGTVTADSTTATNGVFNGSLNGSVTSYVLANGAAAFAGGNGVTTNQSFGIDQYGRVSIREDASGLTDVFAILKGSSTTKTCTISNDGTVTAGLFAATGVNNTGVEAGSGGLLSVQRGPSSGTSDVFRGYQGATVNSRIRADGAVTFAGDATIGKTTTGASDIGARFIKGSSSELLTLDCVNGGSSDVAYQVNNSGSATVQIKADGSANFAGSNFIISSAGTILADNGGNPAGAAKVNINSNGTATFGGNVLPKIDAGFAGHSDLGSSSKRFEDAFVRDGVTTGSDKNYKSDIRELLDAERSVAVACKSLLRAWKWTSAVSAKGDAARIHIGIIAQDLEQAFADQGLDAHNYAMFCEDTWYEVDGQQEDADGDKYTADSEGAVAVTRLSVRYHELLAFIIAAI